MRVPRIGPLSAILLIGASALGSAGVSAHGAAPTTIPASERAIPDLTIPPLLATVGPTGGNGSTNPVWMVTSADASHVVYRTREALTAGDTNLRLDLYDWSQADGVRLITAGSTTEPSYEATLISADGEHVFVFTPDPLLPEDVDSDTDVYEWAGGSLTLASTSPTDSGSNFNYPLGMTPDGATLYFYSSGHLAPEDTDESVDIYRRTGGVVSLLSVTATAGNGSHSVTFNGMSADGSHLFFQTAEQLDPADTDPVVDLYEWSSAGIALVSTGPTDTGNNDGAYQASTADGSHVYFSTGGQLTADDTDVHPDSYERSGGVTRLVSVGPASEEAGNYARVWAVSTDGSRLILDAAGRLSPDDTDNSIDTYVLDDGAPTLLMQGLDEGQLPLIHGMTPDGSRIVFSTLSALAASDADGAMDIYSHTDAGNEHVSRAPGDPSLGLDAEFYGMSTDGLRVYFRSGEPLDAQDSNSDYDIAIWDDGDVARLPIPGSGRLLEYNGSSTDGERLFIRTSVRLASSDTDSSQDIYQFSLPDLPQSPPGAPTGVSATGGDQQATVTWTAPVDDGDSLITGYTVTSSPGSFTTTVGGSANSATLTGLTNGTSYTFRVAATNGIGTGPPSSPSNAVTPFAKTNQTIAFGSALPNRTMLQPPVTVSATASSGLAVSFTTTTPTVCTSSGANGQTITPVGAGTCIVRADQAGNATYNAAPSVSRSFTVSRVNQTITFAVVPNKTLAQSPFTVSATAPALPVTFASTTPFVCSSSGVNGSTIALLSAGSCTIVASQAGNATYNAAPDRPRTFTVTLAGQAITFVNPGARTLAQSPLTVSATAQSGLPVSFATTTPTVCASGGVNGTVITLVATGSCSVVASQSGNATYAPAPSITRTFNVTQATQSITFAQPPTAHLSQSPLTMSATASSGLPVTFTTTSTAVCTSGGANGATITLLRAGTCRVVASQTGNTIYRPASNVPRTFTVTTAALAQTITFGALGSRSIGELPLTLTASASSGLPITYTVAASSSAICSVSGSVLTLENPGTCTVTASQAGNATYQAATAVSQSLTVTLGGFVQASGANLLLDGQPFTIFGAAIYETSNYGHTADPDEVFAWADQANLNTLRLTDIFNQTTNDPAAPYAEADWQWIDGLIARAGDQGMKVILDLSSYRNWLVWSSQIDHGWVVNCQAGQDRTPVDYAALDPYTVAHRADWTAFMNFVANRVNTVTGITYRKDPTILVVSIAGEPVGAGYGECGKASSEQELTDFFAWALAEWKSLDPHHLRSTGGLHGTYAGLDGNGDPIPSGQQVDGFALFSLADNTLPSVDTYPPQTTQLPLADGQTPVLAPVAQALVKPWFTEEFGFRQEEGDAFRATEFDAIYDAQTAYGSAGSLFWNLGPEIGVGTFDVNPSTPLTWARILAEAP